MSYAIYAKQHYYAGALNVPESGLLRSPYDGDVIALATRDEAERIVKMLDWRPDGTVELSQNQYASTDYSVRKSNAEAGTIKWAMNRLGLDYDFDPVTGEKLELTERDMYGDV